MSRLGCCGLIICLRVIVPGLLRAYNMLMRYRGLIKKHKKNYMKKKLLQHTMFSRKNYKNNFRKKHKKIKKKLYRETL